MGHRRLVATRALLLVYCVLLGILTGGGLYQHFLIVPLWESSQDIVRTYSHGFGFFPIMTPSVTLVATLLAFVGWRSPRPMKGWLYGSLVPVLVLVVLTFVYYLPQLMRFESGELDGPGFTEAVRLWAGAELPRQLLGPFLLAAAIHAYGLSYRAESSATVREPVEAA